MVAPGEACNDDGIQACIGVAQTGKLICRDGFWTGDGNCPNDTVCDPRDGTQGECSSPLAGCDGQVSGDTFCDGQKLMACGDDLLTASEQPACIDQACVDGACDGVCAPGAGRCAEGGAETCNDFGQWGTGVVCTNQACVAGACVGECTPGVKRCDGTKVPQTCSAQGLWESGAACDKICSGGECSGTCTPGLKKCNGQKPQTCDDNATWQEAAACSNKACVDGSCVGECSPQTKKCSGNGVQTCGDSGVFGTAVPCVNQACSGSACTGVCEPGAKHCAGNSVETCSAAGAWANATACINKACTGAGNCTGVCAPQSTRCSGNGVQTCDSTGNWGNAAACVNQACTGSGSGACTGVCTPGALRCNGNGVQTCSAAGAWGTAVSCGAMACVVNECVGTCSPNSTRCSGNGVQTCDANGNWGTAAACSNKTCSGGQCVGTCVKDEVRCTGNSVETCNNVGVWAAATACSNKTCVSGVCTGVCAPNAKRCSADGNGSESCGPNGQYQTADVCTYPNDYCSAGNCTTNPSCAGPLSKCGAGANEDCCASPLVNGGFFYRGKDNVDSSDNTYGATVSSFRLDKFEVTVGRYRNFIAAVVAGWLPPPNGGKHVHLNSGAGLKAGAGNETGWLAGWNSFLWDTTAEWNSALTFSGGSWTAAKGTAAAEARPLDMVNWYEAYAFCIWDGGFLASEAEWHYAASGGLEQRYYPWTTTNDISQTYVVMYPDPQTQVVGSRPLGNGKYGQSDLVGNVSEWVMDQGSSVLGSQVPYIPYANPCDNCMTTASDGQRNQRGGHINNSSYMPNRFRDSSPDNSRTLYAGFRCAYEPN